MLVQREELDSFVCFLQRLSIPNNDGLLHSTINANHKYYYPVVIFLKALQMNMKIIHFMGRLGGSVG